jgi:hypothetical protein
MTRFFKSSVASSNDGGRHFQQGTALNRVLQEAPFLARCSDNKTAARVRPRHYALRWPYMQVNRPGMVSWLIFDLDHNNCHVWEDAGLPAPNLVVRDRSSGHSHLFYAIPPVCTTEMARSKPIEYMKAVYEAMAVRLQADLAFHSGPVAKTPGHPWWDTWEIHAHVHELGQLAEYVDLAPKPRWGRGPDLEAVSHSRHCLLFEQLRYFAYSIVGREREKGSFDTFNRLLEAYAYNANSYANRGFSQDLPLASIKATVKSVARWTWDRYTGVGRCHRGAMQLDKALPLEERQRLAGLRTAELRRRATESKVRAAARLLLAKGSRLALAAVARATGLSRQTIAQYRHVLDEVVAATTGVVTELPKAVASIVKFGVHQVPGASAAPESGSISFNSFEPLRGDRPEPAS